MTDESSDRPTNQPPDGPTDGLMNHPADEPATIYALYPVFKASSGFRRELAGADDVRDAAQEIENLHKAWAGTVDVRGTYSTVGFRADADLMLWLVGRAPHDVQRFLVEYRRTRAGRLMELSWTFMGAVKPAEFTPDHQPAFVKGTPPGTFLCVYPFVRTPEWYLLPREERGELLREHGVVGREFPQVLANTTSGFGLGDWEWILAFEAERADTLVDVIRELRNTKARLYTKVEIPFVTGIRKPVADALDDLI
jgi:hydrogen peroxide-dependent heme synthase